MTILAYVKLGAVAVLLIAGAYFYLDYSHLKSQNAALKYQNEQLEAAAKFYEAQPEIDKHTQEMKNEIRKAVDSGDLDNVKWLYNQLRQHKRPGRGQPAPTPDDGGTDE